MRKCPGESCGHQAQRRCVGPARLVAGSSNSVWRGCRSRLPKPTQALLGVTPAPTSSAETLVKAVRRSTRQSNVQSQEVSVPPLPLYVCLEADVLTPANSISYQEALRSGLKALKSIGVTGVVVEVFWGIVEKLQPQCYNWSTYRHLFKLIRDEGLAIKVALCFNRNDYIALPDWVLAEGQRNPDIFYTDRAGNRSLECLSLGVDHVPALAGRTGLQAYHGLMASLRDEFGPWLGSSITELSIGVGPSGQLRYPSHPPDKRWNFPGVGEFQCYDKYMLATLHACAEQVGQPSWGLSGPHDAGSYCLWPHQTGFFHHHGNWATPYGKFFLQFYSEMLLLHGQAVAETAAAAFDGVPVLMDVKIPSLYWWFNTASRAPELTAGIYNTEDRNGYLPLFKSLQPAGAALSLRAAEMRTSEQPPQMFCDPDRLLQLQRTMAAALHMPTVLENQVARFDEAALSRMEQSIFEGGSSQGIELQVPRSVVFNRMCDAMFQPGSWVRFKTFVQRVRERGAAAAPGKHRDAAKEMADVGLQ